MLITAERDLSTDCAGTINRQVLLTWRPGESTAGKDVEVQMKHGLAGAGAVIDDHSVSLPVEPFIIRYFFCRQEEMSDEFPVCIVHAVNIGNVFFGNDEQVDRRLWVHVFKSGDRVVLVHDFGGDFFFDDFAEDTVGIASHVAPSPLFRETSEKTAARPGVAGRTGLFYLDQERVLVAVVENFLDALNMP